MAWLGGTGLKPGVRPKHTSAPTPVYALFASARQTSTRVRIFIEAMAADLKGIQT